MPATINPIRKARLKKELLNPKNSIIKAMKNSGYADSTAHRSSVNKSVKICMAEIEEEFKLENVTVDSVLKDLELAKRLCISKKSKDLSSFVRACELVGKYLAMFTDKQEISQAEKEDNQFSLERLSRLKQGNTPIGSG